jgi:hypothetical protein
MEMPFFNAEHGVDPATGVQAVERDLVRNFGLHGNGNEKGLLFARELDYSMFSAAFRGDEPDLLARDQVVYRHYEKIGNEFPQFLVVAPFRL